jgi:hypothetical protein
LEDFVAAGLERATSAEALELRLPVNARIKPALLRCVVSLWEERTNFIAGGQLLAEKAPGWLPLTFYPSG